MDAIAFLNGQAMAGFHGKPAWYNLGEVFTENVRPSDGIVRFGMDYEVLKVPSRWFIPILDPETGKWNYDNAENIEKTSNSFHLVRSTDMHPLYEGSVADRYQVITPIDLANVMDYFFDEFGAITDAIFALYDGQSEVISMKMPDVDDLALGDDSKYVFYLIGQNFHGRGAIRFRVNGFRVVCHNTITAAFSHGSDIRIRHTSSAKEKLAVVNRTWTKAHEEINHYYKNLEKLSSKKIDVPSTIDELLEISEDSSTQTKNKRDLLVSAADCETAGTSGESLADIYHAITFRNTHIEFGRGSKTDEGRITSIFDGQRGKNEHKMWNKLLAMAE